MKHTAGLINHFIGNGWVLKTQGDGIVYKLHNYPGHLSYLDLLEVRIEEGLLHTTLVMTGRNGSYKFGGIFKKKAETIRADLEAHTLAYLATSLKNKNIASKAVSEELRKFLEVDRYVSRMDVRLWLSKVDDIGAELSHPYFDINILPVYMRRNIQQIADIIQEKSPLLAERNEQFIEKAMHDHAELFKKLEEYPLTTEQIRAAVIDEDRNLLVAAAGSGKSSTIIAKIAYLLDRKLAQPSEILALAYNKDAQTELERRIKELVDKIDAPVEGVTAKTFHGLGVDIIAALDRKKPNVAEIAAAGRHRSLLLFNEMVDTLKQRDRSFANKWRQFQLYAKHGSLDLFQVRSRKEYNNYLLEMGARWRQSSQGMRLTIATMDGKEVKSIEEARIANWLMIQGVAYEYERRYECETATEAHRQYLPDFYYPETRVYHEHFALNANGETPPFMGQEYLQGVQWKRRLHQDNQTSLIETTSADFQDGTVFDLLEEALVEQGITFKPLSDEEVDTRIRDSFDPETDIEIFTAVLKHFKANNAQIDWLRQKAKGNPDPFRTRLFIDLFEKIHAEYQCRLGEDIDFEDQINRACDYLEERKYVQTYKYILVDETQDMSQDRKRMLHALLAQKKETKLFAVGDDWQSIYRFSGADIDIMTNFSDHFGNTSRNNLSHTFRSHQGIVDVAATFIQRNPAQLRKQVTAHRDLPGDLVFINEYFSENDRNRQIEYRLGQLNQKAKDKNQRLSVFLLARYHRQKPNRLEYYIKAYPLINIEFKTVHAAKGLEADYVFLLDVNAGRYGFPSRIVDDPLLHLVIPRPEAFPDAEERRLFYVAITRAKIAVLIFTHGNFVSPFIKELAEIPRVRGGSHLQRANPCPDCDTGELKLRKGKYSLFWGCTNYPECKHSEAATCPKCRTGKLVVRNSTRGDFYACNRFPKCRHTENPANGKTRLNRPEFTSHP